LRRSSRGPEGGSFRAHARHAAGINALFAHVDAGWQRHARVLNLGLGGACVLVEEPLSTGDRVILSFTAPMLWDPLRLRGRVAWASSGDWPQPAGMAFEHQSAEGALALVQLILSLADA
jgi:hypothetical protein